MDGWPKRDECLCLRATAAIAPGGKRESVSGVGHCFIGAVSSAISLRAGAESSSPDLLSAVVYPALSTVAGALGGHGVYAAAIWVSQRRSRGNRLVDVPVSADVSFVGASKLSIRGVDCSGGADDSGSERSAAIVGRSCISLTLFSGLQHPDDSVELANGKHLYSGFLPDVM